VTAAMALEEKVVKETDGFYCAGYSVVAGTKISCWRDGGHGSETFAKGVSNSCNPVFMEVASRVGNKKFYEYIEAFGLKERTGIELLGEASGYFHSQSVFNEVELATSAFGQTFKVTPIQMINAAAAVVNGGYLLEPHIVKEIVDESGNIIQKFEPKIKRQVISFETSKIMCSLLENVVSEGTGTNAYIAGYRVGGKTGTSEKRDKLDEFGQHSYRIASFLGFAPADDPQIMCLIILDEPDVYPRGGGALAAPVVRNVLGESLAYLGVKKQYKEGENADVELEAPDLIGRTLEEAQEMLKRSAILYEIFGDKEDIVTKQIPKAGTMMNKKSKVFLYFGEDAAAKTVIVPRVIGDSPQNAQQAMFDNDLNIEFIGGKLTKGAVVVRQDPMPGTEMEVGSIIKVEFSEYSVE